MTRRRWSVPSELPAEGAWVPGCAPRVAVAALGVLLTVDVVGISGWLVAGALLAIAAALVPRWMGAWVLIVFLAAGELGRHPQLSGRFLILLAGVHLLHVLGMFSLELPWRGWVQPAVFGGSLRRFVAVQLPTQVLAVVALLVLAPGHHGHRPVTAGGLAVAGALALIGVGIVLFGSRPADGVG